MSLESGYVATLIAHFPDGDIKVPCEKWENGTIDSPDTTHRNAVTRKVTARGGLATRGPVTLSAECDLALWNQQDKLESGAGWVPITAVRQMFAGGQAVGDVKERTGILKSVVIPDFDLESEAVGMAQFECTLDQ